MTHWFSRNVLRTYSRSYSIDSLDSPIKDNISTTIVNELIPSQQIVLRASRAVKSIIFGNYRLLVGVDKQKKTPRLPRTRNGNDNASSSHPAAFAQSPRKSSAMPTYNVRARV